jgi:hypothetical protein
MGLFSSNEKGGGSAETRKFHTSYGPLLTDGEIIEVGFVVFRDTFLFTNKRLILIDVQGISGRQLEYFSVPYGKISKFSVRTGGSFEPEADLRIWVGSDSIPIEKKFTSDVNVYELQKVLASHVLK